MDPSDFVIDVLSLGGTRTSDLPLLPSLESIGRKSTPSNTNTSELVSPASFNKNYVINDSNGIKLASMLPNAHIHAVFLGINIPRDGEYPEYLLDELIQLMVLMGAHSQGLKTLYVTSLAGSMSLKASELSLGNKTELEEVYIGTLGSSEALHDFSALPKLKYLDIQVAWQEAESDWNTGCFSSLEVLHLRRGQSTGGSPIRLFGPGRYTTPRLRQVKSISQDDDGHLSLISDLTHCRDTLEDVSLYRVTNQSPILVHLQQFSNLLSIRISCNTLMRISDTEMQTLASALPRLRELRIWLANLTLVVSPHTVLSIWYLLNGCLDLEILQLEVDGTKQMPFPEEQVSAPDKHRVVKTELGGFRKGDPDWKRIWFQELAMRLNVHFDWGIYAGVYAWT